MKQRTIFGIIAIIALTLTACPPGPGPDPDPGDKLKTLSGNVTVSPNGTVNVNTELTAAYSGTETVTYQWYKDNTAISGAISARYTPTTAGSYTVTVNASGYTSKTSAAVTVTAAAITYTAVQSGGTDNVTNSTGIVFTFSGSVDSLNLTAAEFTVGGTAAKGTAGLSGTGTTRMLAITVSAAGTATVQINKTGIEAETKHVAVYKAGETAPTLTGITAAYTGTAAIYPATPLDSLKAGLTVKAQYSNSSENNLSAGEYTLSGTLTVGSSTVTVTYEGKTTTFAVTVTVTPATGPGHTHSYSAAWSSNATQHWRECTANDGAKTDEGNHTGNPCNVCGYTSGGGGNNTGVSISSLAATGITATLTIPASGNTATLEIKGAGANFSNAALNSMPQIGQNLAGKNVTVNLSSTGGAANISLAYVHYVRAALLAAGATGVAVSETGNFTPMFDGRDWFTYDTNERNLYSQYPAGTTQLMNGIEVKGQTGKYAIEYNRDLKVSRLVWQNSSTDHAKEDGTPFNGFGLKKANGGSIINSNGVLVLGGNGFEEQNPSSTYPVTDNFATYDAALETAGLHPAQGVLLDHSHLQITGVGANHNVAKNGMYDFILAYYNPGENDATVQNRGLLPGFWPEGLIFDGSDNKVASRTIGGITANNDKRKGTDGVNGAPNNNFVGNITVPMAKYLTANLFANPRITELRNTNILGPGSAWNGTSTVDLPNTINVGLIGNYNGINLIGSTRGVTDISGGVPNSIGKGSATRTGFLNLWTTDVSSEALINGFDVIRVHGTRGGNIQTGAVGVQNVEARLIIYDKKYNSLAYANLSPNHRAFMVGVVAKVTGGSTPSTNTAIYQGSSPTSPVPNPEEGAWITFGNNGSTGSFPQLAANYNALPADRKITQVEFDGLE
jgi:hypothetical protein